MFNHEEVRKYLGINPPRDEHAMIEIIKNRTETKWTVALKETDEFIGDAGLRMKRFPRSWSMVGANYILNAKEPPSLGLVRASSNGQDNE